MGTYDVVLVVPVKIPFAGIEADSQIDAIKIAAEGFSSSRVVLARVDGLNTITDYVEAEPDIISAAVNEEGDEDYERSPCYVQTREGYWEVEA